MTPRRVAEELSRKFLYETGMFDSPAEIAANPEHQLVIAAARTADAIEKALHDQIEAKFKRGVKEAFDFVLMACANHYHGNPETQKICDIENKYAETLAKDFLRSLSPADHTEWKNLSKAQSDTAKLRDLAQRLLDCISNPRGGLLEMLELDDEASEHGTDLYYMVLLAKELRDEAAGLLSGEGK